MRGKPKVAAGMIAGRQAGLGFQPWVEIDSILVKAADGSIQRVKDDMPCRIGRGTRRQFVFFAQNHISHPLFRQVIGDAAADCATANDQDIRRILHRAPAFGRTEQTIAALPAGTETDNPHTAYESDS